MDTFAALAPVSYTHLARVASCFRTDTEIFYDGSYADCWWKAYDAYSMRKESALTQPLSSKSQQMCIRDRCYEVDRQLENNETLDILIQGASPHNGSSDTVEGVVEQGNICLLYTSGVYIEIWINDFSII